MDKHLFDELVLSIKEAGAIARGEIEPIRTFTLDKQDIKAIRQKTSLSQNQFAQKLEISSSTLKKWEQGVRNPTGPAKALLKILDKQPQLLELA